MTPGKKYKIKIVIFEKVGNKLKLNLDFTFNKINSIRKVSWANEAPWYREVSDGRNWFCYCLNKLCQIGEQLFVV